MDIKRGMRGTATTVSGTVDSISSSGRIVLRHDDGRTSMFYVDSWEEEEEVKNFGPDEAVVDTSTSGNWVHRPVFLDGKRYCMVDRGFNDRYLTPYRVHQTPTFRALEKSEGATPPSSEPSRRSVMTWIPSIRRCQQR